MRRKRKGEKREKAIERETSPGKEIRWDRLAGRVVVGSSDHGGLAPAGGDIGHDDASSRGVAVIARSSSASNAARRPAVGSALAGRRHSRSGEIGGQPRTARRGGVEQRLGASRRVAARRGRRTVASGASEQRRVHIWRRRPTSSAGEQAATRSVSSADGRATQSALGSGWTTSRRANGSGGDATRLRRGTATGERLRAGDGCAATTATRQATARWRVVDQSDARFR
ncbi:hypothetical protein Syun_006654 [Stephania yunnanensis]|uniref:Uncharacterized protein n=1 Tax=Stephania yunnanensis TaxID=152371 RepID=A0AAP0PXU2_9MAGN